MVRSVSAWRVGGLAGYTSLSSPVHLRQEAIFFEVLGHGAPRRSRSIAKVVDEIEHPGRIWAAAGHERVAGRGAEGVLHVGALEKQRVPREAVQIGRPHKRVTVRTNIGAQVIDDDQQNVAYIVRRGSRRRSWRLGRSGGWYWCRSRGHDTRSGCRGRSFLWICYTILLDPAHSISPAQRPTVAHWS